MMKFAIYDIDYTVISTNSLFDVVLFLFRKKPFKMIYIPFLILVSIMGILRIISLETLKSYWLILFTGMSKEELSDFSKIFFEIKIIPKIKKGAVENIEQNRQEGRKIMFVTASFEFYIKPLADYLNVDYFIGTKAFFKNNRLKPKLDGKNCKGKEKIDRILNVISKDEIDRENSLAYSDSWSDLPFLELSGTFHKIKPSEWFFEKIIKK